MAAADKPPVTTRFKAMTLRGNLPWTDLAVDPKTAAWAAAAAHAPAGDCVFWGLPFRLAARPLVLREGGRSLTRKLDGVRAPWIVVAHTSNVRPSTADDDGFRRASTGEGRLGEHAANYIFVYADGSEERAVIRRRLQVGAYSRRWGENCAECVTHSAPQPLQPPHEHARETAAQGRSWGLAQTRATGNDGGAFVYWLWAWENPRPRQPLVRIQFEPVSGELVVAGLSVGRATCVPLRWESRRKAVLRLPPRATLDRARGVDGQPAQIRLDMGRVISTVPRPMYPDSGWDGTYNNAVPTLSERDVLVEYTAHPDAVFHLPGGQRVSVATLEKKGRAGALTRVPPATQRVKVRVVERGSGRAVAAKLHIHGGAGEYLPPMTRHRRPNPGWFEDYSCDYLNRGIHLCTYIPGETDVRLPLGEVFVEVSKGFEIRPVRKSVTVDRCTHEMILEIETVLPWRELGWVSADTHVHFLSPGAGLLEGAGEGVNVVNLLASQWGELMTNVGDFDGVTTHAYSDGGTAPEYLLRVGTENRQHILGHISLIGYDGPIIAPMCSGGPDEAALGDPVEVLLTEWARQCRDQGGVVVIPHFPNPRLEHAATIVSGDADAVEMACWGDLYSGISAYSLSDWYRYLNNGYFVAAVGGTDKMGAATAVGAVRTYARIADGEAFTYEAWKDAVRRGETFVTYGPLLEFAVDGRPMGARIGMTRHGGTVDVTWRVASVTVPMHRVDLMANGEVVGSCAVDAEAGEGHFRVPVERSTWLALLVRGGYPDKPEMIAAHSSPVMIDVEGTPFYRAADLVTILEQVEGALAYVDTLGTRAEAKTYKRMRLVLTSVHRELHNRMHRGGVYHRHPAATDHPDHH